MNPTQTLSMVEINTDPSFPLLVNPIFPSKAYPQKKTIERGVFITYELMNTIEYL